MRDHLRLRLFHYPAVGALEDIDAEIAFTVPLFDECLMRNDGEKTIKQWRLRPGRPVELDRAVPSTGARVRWEWWRTIRGPCDTLVLLNSSL